MGRGLLKSLCLVCVAFLGCAASTPARAQASFHVLLVGVTEYENIEPFYKLKGPGNDLPLLSRLLQEKFNIPEKNICLLSEATGKANPALRPTKEHIAREFRRIASTAKKGDQVILFLSGHGSQQPDQTPPDPNDPEPDGLDEVFLPTDVADWDGAEGTLKNALVDDELRIWLDHILDTGAYVCVIVDACFSGTITRDLETKREIPYQKLLPREVVQSLRRTRGAADAAQLIEPSSRADRLVALYAAQSFEPTVERPMPYGAEASAQEVHGLFAYTICQILGSASEGLSYRELIQRVQAQYDGWGRRSPTPLLEGAGDLAVFSPSKEKRPSTVSLRLHKTFAGLEVSAGQLHGLTAGSILGVYPPPGKKRDPKVPLGYLRVEKAGPFTSRVTPIAYRGRAAARTEDLEEGSVCERLVTSYEGLVRLRVAVDPQDQANRPINASEREQLRVSLEKLASQPGALLELVDDLDRADWLVRRDGGKTYLFPVGETTRQGGATRPPSLYGPAPAGEPVADWLNQQFARIIRASSIKRLAAQNMNLTRDEGVRVEVELRRAKDDRDVKGVPIPLTNGRLSVSSGDPLLLRLSNPNRFAIDVTVLYIDNDFGITALYPQRNEVNRLNRGEAYPLGLDPTADTLAREHLVVIAVEGEGQPVEFTGLAQPTLERARESQRSRGEQAKPFDTPLGRLLGNAVYPSRTRGPAQDEESNYAIRMLTLQLQPKEARREK
jgi:hypothetical protein